MTRVAIDPNLRTPDNVTITSLDNADGELHADERVTVYQEGTMLEGIGQVIDIDLETRVAYIAVNWFAFAYDSPRDVL